MDTKKKGKEMAIKIGASDGKRKLYSKVRRKRMSEMYTEALQNVRNTITVVAILIATVAFTAGLTPPGGVHQDGRHIGRATLAGHTSFKVFAISNDLALLLAISIVVVLTTIVPFRRKKLQKIVAVMNKVTWVAVAFLMTAYVAGRWATIPDHLKGREGATRWMFPALVSICGGLLGMVFLALTTLLVYQKKVLCFKSRGRNCKTEEVKDSRPSSILSPSSFSGEFDDDILERGLIPTKAPVKIENSRIRNKTTSTLTHHNQTHRTSASQSEEDDLSPQADDLRSSSPKEESTTAPCPRLSHSRAASSSPSSPVRDRLAGNL